MRVATLLKQINAAAATSATQDQASDHTAQSQPRREAFELNITEEEPTEDQVRTIADYLGTKDQISKVFAGAGTADAALKAFKQNPASFTRPVVGFLSLLRSGLL